MIISGKNINLRLVEEGDAEFIVNLRLKKGDFLSPTNSNILNQVQWIESYKRRESSGDEFYFIIENKTQISLGTTRIYHIDREQECFTFGSFIVDKHLGHKLSAPEAMYQVMRFGFNRLLMKNCFFDCKKKNINAVDFYKRFGAQIISENEYDYFFSLSIEDFLGYKEKYKRFL